MNMGSSLNFFSGTVISEDVPATAVIAHVINTLVGTNYYKHGKQGTKNYTYE